MKKLSELITELCSQIEALPAGEQQTQVSMLATDLGAAIANAEAKTDDEKITDILAPYLEKMLEKENCSLNDIGFLLGKKGGSYIQEIQMWIFTNRLKTGTLAEVVPAIETFDPAKRAREAKLAKIEELKRELAALEPKGVA